MTITQTVEIPANRRLTIEVPKEIPTGQVVLTFTPKAAEDYDEYTIAIAFDGEAQKWYAQNDDIPIILEDDSIDTLINRVKIAAPEMLEINNMPHKKISLSFKIEPKAVIA